MTGRHLHDFPDGFPLRLRTVLDQDAVPIRARRGDVPEALAAVIHRTLSRDPAQRFANVAAFRAALLP